MKFDINNLVRKNILALKPYSSARDEYSGEAAVFLDANENPFATDWNRYPDPRQTELKLAIAKLQNIDEKSIFLGNGSDEPIDLIIRAFCEPSIDNIVTISPTYGMYCVAANINNIEIREVSLNADYDIVADKLLSQTDINTKLIFLCSPNNPTGNLLNISEIKKVINRFTGLVVVDEAYIDFCAEKSLLSTLHNHPNLIILQTLSKAWGMAGLRLGMAFAERQIIDILSKIKYPYNLNILTQYKVKELLSNISYKNNWVKQILDEREKLIANLKKIKFVEKIYPTDANFVLVKMQNPNEVYNYLKINKIIVRNRSNISQCDGCLRFTIGTTKENELLIETLNRYFEENIIG